MKRVYRVYDDRIVKDLKNEYKIAYELQAKDIRSDRIFFLYINDDKFQNIIKEIEKRYYKDI